VPGAGAILVALNTRLGPDEYAYILDHCRARLLIVDESLLSAVDLVNRASLERVVVVRDARPGDYEAWLASEGEGPGMIDPVDEHALIAINYTSGTTGRPKGVMYTHRGAYLNSVGTAMTFGVDSHSVYLWTLPMFHCNGWCFTWAVTAMAGRHVCIPRPDADAVLTAISDQGVTHFCAAPVVLSAIVNAPGADPAALAHRVRAATGGSPPAPTVIASAERMGIDVMHLYGMTETYGPSLVCEAQTSWAGLPLSERAALMARQGVRTAVVDAVRVVDLEGKDVAADATAIGEIVVRSNTVMAGYFEDADATAEALRGGWLHTGDLAVVHPDGYLEIRDRSKDIIISGGENISSVEVEHALLAHPAVSEAAVVAMPHSRWGEVPVAFVTLAPGQRATADELTSFVGTRIARFKVPYEVVFSDLPKTATGKVQKAQLRARARGTVQP